MTLVLAFKWRVGAGDAVLISSDSRATTPLGIAYEVRKVKPMVFEDRPLAVAGGAGDAALVKWGYEVAEEVLAGEAGERGAPLPAPLFRRAVRMIEDRLAGRLYRLRGLGIEPSFQMVLGSVDGEGRASLYVFDNRGLAEPVHENPGYAVIGSGFITGGLLLLRLLGFSELAASGRTGLLDLGMLTAFIIDVVSEVDTSVGPFVGESWLMRLEERGGEKVVVLGELKPEALREYKDRVERRREVLRRVWALCDYTSEDEILNLLGEYVEGLKREHEEPHRATSRL